MLAWQADRARHLPRLGLSEACRLFGLTPRALRFYEEKGLIEARRDRLNHRFYDGWARHRLGWIARLRGVGLPLPEIQQVLDADERTGGGRQVALRKLVGRRTKLAEELARLDDLIPQLEAETASEAAKPAA